MRYEKAKISARIAGHLFPNKDSSRARHGVAAPRHLTLGISGWPRPQFMARIIRSTLIREYVGTGFPPTSWEGSTQVRVCSDQKKIGPDFGLLTDIYTSGRYKVR